MVDPLPHRMTAWGMNLALGVWVGEAVAVFIALLLIARGGEAGDAAARMFGSHTRALLIAQGAAAAGVLACALIRNSLHAEPLGPYEYAWLGSLLTIVLLGSTLYILVVGAENFRSNQVIVRHIEKQTVQYGKPYEMETRVRETTFDAASVRQAFKEASAELSMVSSLGAFSALGLLVLHFLGWRERNVQSRGRRRGRVPPWREPRPAP